MASNSNEGPTSEKDFIQASNSNEDPTSEKDFIQASNNIEGHNSEKIFIQRSLTQNDECLPSLSTVPIENTDTVKDTPDKETAREVKDEIKDYDDSDQEQVRRIDVFDGSMDRQVEFGHITVSEDALCRDVDLFAKFYPNLASKLLADHWQFFTVGVREERERTMIHGVTDPRLFSNFLTTLSSPEDVNK